PLCPSDIADHGKSRRCQLGHVISCVQSQLITWVMYTDHQGTDDQCALMISVGPEVPPVSAHQCQCPSVPQQCHISVHTSAHQCHISVHTSAHQCHISVPI
ncbi:unnamed protein product, partial [Staurois parvus]